MSLAKIAAFIKQAQAYSKFIVAVVGGLLAILAGYIPVEWAPHIQQALTALTAFAVWAFPNVTPAGDVEYPADEPKHAA